MLNKNYNNILNKKISLSIMSPFLVLTIQFFILCYFDNNTVWVDNIKLLSKIIVGMFFIYSFLLVFKRKRNFFILSYCLSLIIFLINYFFHQENTLYIKSVLFPFFFICLPSFIYSFSIDDRDVFEIVIKKVSFIVYIIGIISSLLVLVNKVNIDLYSMTLSYYMLLPTTIYLREFLQSYSIKYAILILISLVMMIIIGSRGFILSILVYLILYNIVNLRKITKKGIILILCFVIGWIYLDPILQYLINFLNKFGITSRSAILFLQDEIHWSGRDKIYTEMLYQIKANPILGIGLTGDRFILNGTYSHNIFLEILSGFGLIFGGFLIFVLIIITYKSLFSKDIKGSNLVLIWFTIGLVPLIISGTYLTSFQFWIFIGIATRLIID